MFADPSELSDRTLCSLYLTLADWEDLQQNYDEKSRVHTIPQAEIEAVLGRSFRDFDFDIAQCSSYDAAAQAVVTPFISPLWVRRSMSVPDWRVNKNTVRVTVRCNQSSPGSPELKKLWTLKFYDGGASCLSAEETELGTNTDMENCLAKMGRFFCLERRRTDETL